MSASISVNDFVELAFLAVLIALIVALITFILLLFKSSIMNRTDSSEKKEMEITRIVQFLKSQKIDQLTNRHIQSWRDERVQLESVMNQRFHFMIIVLGFVMVSIPNVDTSRELQLVFALGLVMCTPLMLLIKRAYARHSIHTQVLGRMENEPIGEVGKIVGERGSKVRLVGEIIPIGICVLLLIGIVISSWISDFIIKGS